jgi:hypothetical protein
MNMIEERIRAAARAAADTVTPDSVPDLELPAARSRRLGRQRRPTRSTWTPWAARLAPAAAALVVVAIVITVVEVNPAPRQGGLGLATGTAARPAVPAGPRAGSYVRSGQVPTYFVAITASGAAVRLTASGATVATIAPSLPGGTVIAVTAAGDDRTFVLAETARDTDVASFYQYRLGTSGRPGAPARLPMSVAESKMMTSLALSPDGTRLAIAIGSGDGVQQVKLYPVHGGPARTWSAAGDAIGDLSTSSLSWTADQRTLAFDWQVDSGESVRLLDTSSGGGSLLAASHQAVTVANSASSGHTLYSCPLGVTITPDGSAVVCPSSSIMKVRDDGSTINSTGFAEFSTATGRLTRILGHWAQGQQPDPMVERVLWSDASGRVLIGVISSAGRDWIGIISGNTFTPLNARWTRTAYNFGAW